MGGTDADGNFIQMQHMGHVPESSRQAALLATLGGFCRHTLGEAMIQLTTCYVLATHSGSSGRW